MIELLRYTPDQWYAYAEGAHAAVFRRERAPWVDRISFALLAVDGEKVVGYVTCRETDNESLYWQFGGSVDEHRGISSFRAFQALLDYTRSRYKRCDTYVKNDNIGYLHLLHKQGFRVVGTRSVKGGTWLDLNLEFDDAVQEQGAEGFPLHEAPQGGERVGQGNTQRSRFAGRSREAEG